MNCSFPRNPFLIVSLYCVLGAILLPTYLAGQTDTLYKVDANFLFNYYEQDGVHAAVTGGQGTEELRDRAFLVTLEVPLDSLEFLSANIGTNIYSSASTDRIDSRMSSASSQDFHTSIDLGWQRRKPTLSYGFLVGGAIESDYLSLSFGANVGWNLTKVQGRLQAGFRAFFDRWILYFPEELRGQVQPTISTDKRNSYHLEIEYHQVINKRMQGAVLAGVTLQQGLLSTPFHRVYLAGETLPRIEYLPNQRIKIPLGLRVNIFLADQVILRSYYRYYWDDFGIQAHTASLELPIKVSPQVSLSPFYRYYTQEGSRYFAPFRAHSPTDEYYSSDYDLSGFFSSKFGLGLRYTPFWRMKGFNKIGTGWLLKTISIRGMRYIRSDGLDAWAITLHLNSLL